MRRAFWPLILLLLGAIASVSAIPQPDLPETSYNEVDTPVNQAPPVVAGVKFVRPAIAITILPRQVWEATHDVGAQSHERKSARTPVRPDRHSSQDLLCTFLI
ncbi:MAG TPA: hypothetical protein VKR59_08450 [Terriglobales bacterium]|nr:hypothetical protein [Terriglobales bacterium]